MPSSAPSPTDSSHELRSRRHSATRAKQASPTQTPRRDFSNGEPGNELPLLDLHPAADDMRGDILSGLRSTPKTLPCKYFYDERGSALFDAICELDEYYPTRTETAILEAHAGDMAAQIGKGALVIELGSGSSTKTPLLLDALCETAGYVPIDISREHLLDAAGRIRDDFPDLAVRPVCADFTAPLELPDLGVTPRRRIVFFPGSTMGNFDPAGRRKLLGQMVSLCGPEGGGVLIGLDLLKDRETLEAAYNDRLGVTAAFNLNLLERVNRELDGQFDLARFEHHAPFNAAAERIEMHLVSTEAQTVAIGDEEVRFEAGERVCTEHSHKFSIEGFTRLAREVGLHRRAVWTDEDELFAVLLFETGPTTRA
jgi:dimethylhistidine N-methyltransferase